MTSPKVTVIVVAFNGDRWMPECVKAQQQASACAVHLVIVDNVGNTLLGDLDYGQNQVTHLSCPRPMGFADANNLALAHDPSGASYVCFLNQDTRAYTAWLDACTACLDAHPQTAAVTPLIRTYDNDAWDPSFLDCAQKNDHLYERIQRDQPITGQLFHVPYIPAAGMLVRRSVLQQVGSFDPVYGSYYEDYDLCARIRQAGHQVGICGDAAICHFSGSATDTPQRHRKRMRQIIRNRLIYNVRHSGKSRLRVLLGYWTVQFPRNLARGILRTPSSQPPIVTLAAAGDLLRLTPRLVSRHRDKQLLQKSQRSL